MRHSKTRTSPIFSSFYPSSMAHIDCATVSNPSHVCWSTTVHFWQGHRLTRGMSYLACYIRHYLKLWGVGVIPHRLSVLSIEEGWRQQQRQRPSRLFWGQNLFIQFLAALADLPRSIWKKMLNASFSFKSTNGEFEWLPSYHKSSVKMKHKLFLPLLT